MLSEISWLIVLTEKFDNIPFGPFSPAFRDGWVSATVFHGDRLDRGSCIDGVVSGSGVRPSVWREAGSDP